MTDPTQHSAMFTLAFWEAAAERAVKTAAQAAFLAAGADSLAANALTFDWAQMGGFALGGAALSLLSSLASGLNGGGPSATNAETLPDA